MIQCNKVFRQCLKNKYINQTLCVAESPILQCSDSTLSRNLQVFLQSIDSYFQNAVWRAPGWLCLKPALTRVRTMRGREASPLCNMSCVLTSTNAFDRKCGLGQEVWVGEHVFFVDHKAQEGEFWLVHGESHRFCSFPRWVEAVVTCGGQKDRTPSHSRHHRPSPAFTALSQRLRLDPSSPSLTIDNGL